MELPFLHLTLTGLNIYRPGQIIPVHLVSTSYILVDSPEPWDWMANIILNLASLGSGDAFVSLFVIGSTLFAIL
jgi:hypothetical protein